VTAVNHVDPDHEEILVASKGGKDVVLMPEFRVSVLVKDHLQVILHVDAVEADHCESEIRSVPLNEKPLVVVIGIIEHAACEEHAQIDAGLQVI